MTSPVPRRAEIKPLAPDLYAIRVTVSRETYDKFQRAQTLSRHTNPTGDPAVVIDRALTAFVADLERTRFAAVSRPRGNHATATTARHIPAAIKREVWARDGGQCAFVGHAGRCLERGFLEFHHVQPYAAGGETSALNLQLRCRAHNVYESKLYFGLGAASDVEEVSPPLL